MTFLLWLLALLIGIFGVVQLVRGELILGVILIVVAFIVGPGGYSLFTR